MDIRIKMYLVEVVVEDDGRDKIVPIEIDPRKVWNRDGVLPFAEQVLRDEGHLVKRSCFVS